MDATIVNYRMGRHVQTGNQMIIVMKDCTDKETAQKMVGKTVVWKTSAGKEIKGEVRAAHGNKGALRVLFEKGMPGQAVGTRVEIK
ncbi:50S ribosomal protein L35ae [Candidatus Woesearchaeota archaeon]|nr:MAG: 50S ribosomal protein L35ae [Candidatus Woesearchaeota archaeon]